MIKRSKLVWGSLFTVALAGLGAFFFLTGNRAPEKSFEEIRAIRGSISSAVSTTGVVEPKNRLKIQSSIGGRVEAILVAEGQYVKKGEVLALISSTERAALLDAARVQGKSEEAYWKRVYKETSIIAPLDGQVIVRSIDPGQAVTTSDSLFVLSDHLIVKAYVDETDIGRVKVGQNAVIGLDAYPDNLIGIRLYESLGMHLDGVLRQNYKSSRGYLDQIIYSMLKTEYNDIQK